MTVRISTCAFSISRRGAAVSTIIDEPVIHSLLDQARAQGAAEGIRYAGSIRPADAWNPGPVRRRRCWSMYAAPRSAKFVGHVPGTLHVAWATGTSLTRNPRFERELEARVSGKDKTDAAVVPQRQALGARRRGAHQSGIHASAFNVLEGFEGDLDDQQQRGALGGWRFHALALGSGLAHQPNRSDAAAARAAATTFDLATAQSGADP